MRKYLLVFVAFLSCLILVACSGSKSLQGEWKAQDAMKKDYTIVFKDKTVTIGDKDYDYSQNGVGNVNGVQYYLLKIKDGSANSTYSIIFPQKDKNVSLMIQPSDADHPLKGQPLFALHRDKTPDFYDYVKNYLK